MRNNENLTEQHRQELEQVHKVSKSYQERNRSQCILLSAQGYRVQTLAQMYKVSALSIYKWFDRFEKAGVSGLKNQKGKGRKAILKTSNAIHVAVVAQSIDQERQRLKLAKAEIEAKLGTSMSEMTLKRFLKKLVTATSACVSG